MDTPLCDEAMAIIDQIDITNLNEGDLDRLQVILDSPQYAKECAEEIINLEYIKNMNRPTTFPRCLLFRGYETKAEE